MPSNSELFHCRQTLTPEFDRPPLYVDIPRRRRRSVAYICGPLVLSLAQSLADVPVFREEAIILRMKNRGHDYLDSVRNPEIWKKTKRTVGKVGGGAALEVVKDIASRIMAELLKTVHWTRIECTLTQEPAREIGTTCRSYVQKRQALTCPYIRRGWNRSNSLSDSDRSNDFVAG